MKKENIQERWLMAGEKKKGMKGQVARVWLATTILVGFIGSLVTIVSAVYQASRDAVFLIYWIAVILASVYLVSLITLASTFIFVWRWSAPARKIREMYRLQGAGEATFRILLDSIYALKFKGSLASVIMGESYSADLILGDTIKAIQEFMEVTTYKSCAVSLSEVVLDAGEAITVKTSGAPGYLDRDTPLDQDSLYREAWYSQKEAYNNKLHGSQKQVSASRYGSVAVFPIFRLVPGNQGAHFFWGFLSVSFQSPGCITPEVLRSLKPVAEDFYDIFEDASIARQLHPRLSEPPPVPTIPVQKS